MVTRHRISSVPSIPAQARSAVRAVAPRWATSARQAQLQKESPRPRVQGDVGEGLRHVEGRDIKLKAAKCGFNLRRGNASLRHLHRHVAKVDGADCRVPQTWPDEIISLCFIEHVYPIG